MVLNKKRKFIIFVFYSILFCGVLGLSICASIFEFAKSNVYKTIIFSFAIFDVIALILLTNGEALSLKIDKTATKNTLFATAGLFLSFLFSNDLLYSIASVSKDINPETHKTFLILFNLFVLVFALFIFRFFEHDYKTKKYELVHEFSFFIFVVTFMFLTIFDSFIGQYIVLGLECLYLVFFAFTYYKQFKNHENPSAGIISFMFVCIIAVSLILNLFTQNIFTSVNFFGAASLSYFLLPLGYLFIYLNFLIDKTRKTYAFEEIEDKKRDKMKVVCFHSFDCFLGDELLVFPSKKCKEFFALLVILRGKSLTMEKAITYLWPDKDLELAKRSYRDVIYKLRRYLLTDVHFDHISFKRAETILDFNNIDCDYYDILDKKKVYNREPLMPEYDWSLEFENILENL